MADKITITLELPEKYAEHYVSVKIYLEDYVNNVTSFQYVLELLQELGFSYNESVTLLTSVDLFRPE